MASHEESVIVVGAGLAGLATALEDPDALVRATATERLAFAHASAARLLLAAADDVHPEVRRAAHRHLALSPSWILWIALAGSSSAPELLSLLAEERPDCLTALAVERSHSPDPDDRVRAVELAGRLRTPAVTPTIVAAVRDTHPPVQLAAIPLLSGRREALIPLVEALRSSDPRVRRAAAEALDGVENDDAVSALIDALQDPDIQVQRIAAGALVRRRSPGLARRLARAITQANQDTVRAVLAQMGEVGQRALADRMRGAAPVERDGDPTAVMELALLHALEEAARIRMVAAAEALAAKAAILEDAREEAARIRAQAVAEAERQPAPVEQPRLVAVEALGEHAREAATNGASHNAEAPNPSG
jgi:HEAT repeat protein